MKIELKNIQHSESLSEETNAFTANLYIDGKFAGYARNDGRGGNTHIQPKENTDWELIKNAEEYCKTLPPYTYEADGQKHTMQMDLEAVVDDLVVEHLRKKYWRQLERKLSSATNSELVFGLPEGDWSLILKFGVPLADLLRTAGGQKAIIQAIGDVAGELKNGRKLLNTNIPEKILREAGLIEDQYMPPMTPVYRQAKQKGRKNKP